jgi:predicted small lipoprotein YifL
MKTLPLLLMLFCLCACGRKAPVENPNITDDNPVRPKKLSEPLSVLTNATNQAR